MNWTTRYKKAVTFSYDDGVLQDKKLIEILNRYRLKCTFNINTNLGHPHGSFKIGDLLIHRYQMTDLISLYKGHEIASHTLNHFDLTKITNEELIKEIKEDMDNIEKIFHDKPTGFVYPFGLYNQEMKETLKSFGVQYARTINSNHLFNLQTNLLEYRPTCHHNDPLIFELIQRFLSSDSDSPQIFYIWGHSYEFDVDGNWDLFERICQKLANHPDVFYGTNKEVLLNEID